MVKLGKILFLGGVLCAFSFAQAPDSSNQSKTDQESKQIQSTTISSNQTVNIPTDVKPKQPTNWSKIKDLFL
jgi:hypothetical protein